MQSSFVPVKIIVFVCLVISFMACEKDSIDACMNSKVGVLRNFTGLDGCGWIVQLADSSRIEPINLNISKLNQLRTNRFVFNFT